MPAVYSPSTSMYSCPSASHSRQPSPRTTVSGNGALCSVVRVLPPGIASHGLLLAGEAFGVAVDIGLARFGERGLQVGIDQR